jgi:nitrate/TMAO reductase-like tetraheme cytochrome c subunit
MFAKTLMILVPTLALALAIGCSNNSSSTSVGDKAQTAAAPEKGGAELWAENCSRCHNIRPPQSFSSSQWQAVVHHMRQRANLTGQEARAITAFLQSANH